MSDRITFGVSEGRLLILDAETQTSVVHSLDDRRVTSVVPLEGRRSAVVLLETASRYVPEQNLLRIGEDGGILWWADLLGDSQTDSFVSVGPVVVDGIVAFLWSGYRVLLDIDTGHLTTSEFMK